LRSFEASTGSWIARPFVDSNGPDGGDTLGGWQVFRQFAGRAPVVFAGGISGQNAIQVRYCPVFFFQVYTAAATPSRLAVVLAWAETACLRIFIRLHRCRPPHKGLNTRWLPSCIFISFVCLSNYLFRYLTVYLLIYLSSC
jgi:hypothetical protein